jgi:pyrroloquinoline quinone (PQQ) biosynthesis protein C
MISLTQFDDLIRSKSLLTHYFYAQKWNMGELTLDELKIYAKEYYHLAKSVPGIVSRVRDRAVESKPELVKEIEKNIVEETEHIALWKRFGKSLGVSEMEMDSYEPSATVKNAVTSLETLAESSLDAGVAAVYAMELELPAIAQSKKDGLCKWYDLPEANADAHIYFDEHLNEEEHFSVWRSVQIDPVKAKQAIESSLAAQHAVLDGVCDRCGFDMKC